MAYDTPKAAHFEIRDSEGFEILTNAGIQTRWKIAAIVAEKYPCVMTLDKQAVDEIDRICADLSRDGIEVSFRHHREFNWNTAMQEEPKKWKRGDIGPDGRIFWHYQSSQRERWMTRGEFDFNKLKESNRIRIRSESAKENAKKRAQSDGRKKINRIKTAEWKRKNPELLKQQRERRKEKEKKQRAEDSAALMFFQITDAATKIEAALGEYSPPVKKQKNPELKPDGTKWRSGDIGPDGSVFIYYRKNGAYWSTMEVYEIRKIRTSKSSKAFRARNPEKAKEQGRRAVAAWKLRNPEKWLKARRERDRKRERSPEYKKRKNARKAQKQKQKRQQKNEK